MWRAKRNKCVLRLLCQWLNWFSLCQTSSQSSTSSFIISKNARLNISLRSSSKLSPDLATNPIPEAPLKNIKTHSRNRIQYWGRLFLGTPNSKIKTPESKGLPNIPRLKIIESRGQKNPKFQGYFTNPKKSQWKPWLFGFNFSSTWSLDFRDFLCFLNSYLGKFQDYPIPKTILVQYIIPLIIFNLKLYYDALSVAQRA